MLAPSTRTSALLRPLVPVAAALLALVDAALIVKSPGLGLALPLGIVFVALAVRNVQAAAALWIVVVYCAGLPGLESLSNRVVYVVAFCWLGQAAARRAAGRPVFPSGRAMIVVVVAFLLWQAASVGWAPIPADGQQQFKDLFCIALGFLVIASGTTAPEHVRWLAMAFVAGATLSVVGGVVANGGFTKAQDISDTATSRFGAGNDPNYLAAMIVPALAFVPALWVRATTAQRGVLLGATTIMAIGLAATQSRGGYVALAATLLAALVLLRGRRIVVVAMIGVILAGGTAYFIAYPAAWQRVHAVQDAGSGSGRTDIWQVAWRVAEDHWVVGVGLAQFPNVSPQYTRLPGNLNYVTNIVDQHIVVHNVYLQLFAETGVIGLLLYLLAAALALSSAWRASTLFEESGDQEMVWLSRSVMLAVVGVLAGSLFLSNILARQIWVLFALGPAVYTIARHELSERESAADRA